MGGYTGRIKITLENTLDAEHLMSVAMGAAKLDDFGDIRIVEPHREQLAAAARCIPFSKTGLENFTSGIVNELVNRLRLEQDLKRYPEILDYDGVCVSLPPHRSQFGVARRTPGSPAGRPRTVSHLGRRVGQKPVGSGDAFPGYQVYRLD